MIEFFNENKHLFDFYAFDSFARGCCYLSSSHKNKNKK